MNINQVLELGITAYREGNYTAAAEYFNQVLDEDSGEMLARLYLGMSYYGSGELDYAQNVFKYLKKYAIDEQLKVKANFALTEIEKDIKCSHESKSESLLAAS
jgi:lipoprotein NlpI